MRRIKVGDHVCLFSRMNKVGVVLEVYTKKNTTWLVGGAMSKTSYVKVQYEDDTVVEHYYSDLLLQD